MRSVQQPTDVEPRSLEGWLDLAEQSLDDVQHGLGVADLILSAALTGDLARDIETWRLSECDLGQHVRRVERLRQRRSRIVGPLNASSPDELIRVAELAAGIRRTEGTTRRLLDASHIPGARRKTPGVKNSPWLIPASAVEAFNRRET
jgi:hypothetical protein